MDHTGRRRSSRAAQCKWLGAFTLQQRAGQNRKQPSAWRRAGLVKTAGYLCRIYRLSVARFDWQTLADCDETREVEAAETRTEEAGA